MFHFTVRGSEVTVSIDQIILLITGIGLLMERISAWAQRRNMNALAAVTGGASRAAGRVILGLQEMPAGADAAIVKAGLIAREAKWLATEFAPKVKIVGGDPDKLAGMIEGEIGKLPAVVAPAILGEVMQAPDNREHIEALTAAVVDLRNELQPLRQQAAT